MGEQKRPHPKSYYDAHGGFNSTKEFVLELALYGGEEGDYVNLQTALRLVWPSGVVPNPQRLIECGNVTVCIISTLEYPFEKYRGGHEVKLAAAVITDELSGFTEDSLYELVDELNKLAYSSEWEGKIVTQSRNLGH